MKKFKPILGDLSKLTDQEKLDYYLAVCEFLGIPSELNLIEYMWFENESNQGRRLVLYAKKGATDLIRESRGINTDKLTREDGEGYVSYICEASNKKGRKEIAVGAASTKGLSGKTLIDAVMTAQTRATRRVTLQFVGCGLIDESEVPSGAATVNILNASAPLSQIAAAAPIAAPNAQVGKDTTPTPEPVKAAELPQLAQDAVIEQPAQQPAVEPAAEQPVEAAEPVKKRRRRKTVTLDTPEQAETRALEPIPAAPETVQAVVVVEQPVLPNPPVEPAVAAVLTPEPPIKLAPIAGLPDAKKELEYRSRLTNLINNDLEPNGFRATEELGGTREQIKKFVKKMFPDMTGKPTVAQWDFFFNFIETKKTELGLTGVVKLIYSEIKEG